MAPIRVRHPLRSAAALFHSKWFALGWLIAILAWVLHAGALARAPLSIVQAVLSGGLVFLAVLAEYLRRRRRAAGDLRAPPRPAPRRRAAARPGRRGVVRRLGCRHQVPHPRPRTAAWAAEPVDADRAPGGNDRVLRVRPQPPARARRRGHRLYLCGREPVRGHRRDPRLRPPSAPAHSRSAPASSRSASSSPAQHSCPRTTPSSQTRAPHRSRAPRERGLSLGPGSYFQYKRRAGRCSFDRGCSLASACPIDRGSATPRAMHLPV